MSGRGIPSEASTPPCAGLGMEDPSLGGNKFFRG